MTNRISLFFSSFRTGGIERVQLNLAGYFLKQNNAVDLVVVKNEGAFTKEIPKQANVIHLGASRTLRTIPALIKYMHANPPHVMLASQTHNNTMAIIARRLARADFKLIVAEHTDLNMVSKNRPLREKLRPLAARLFYPHADAILAVSSGVADALSQTSGLPRHLIHVINNPVVTPDILKRSEKSVEHPWLEAKQTPVLVAVGRLNEAKDYPTLIKSLKILSSKRAIKCIILGEGEQRESLEKQISLLGLSNSVDMLGFVPNPYAFIAKADLLVLSSKREGFANVLVEAMACGAPVVSTDCPSGPAEILENGKYGPLVPVGDSQALAGAILKTLDDPIPAQILKTRAAHFSVEKIADQYIRLLFPD